MSTDKINRKAKCKRILSWIVTILCIIFLLIAVFLVALCYLAIRNGSRSVEIFGYSFSIVQTDSMSPEIGVGELITVKICGIEEAEVGANAVFIETRGELTGLQIVHKVIRTDSDEKGVFIVTKGVKEGAPEDQPVYQETFVGIAVKHSAFWGKVASFFASPVNWVLILILLIGIPAVYMFTKMVVRFYKESRKEKAQADTAEREKLKLELLREYQNKNNTNQS